ALQEFRFPEFGVPPYAWQPPASALVARSALAPLLYDSQKGTPEYDSSQSNLLGEVRLCLTLVGPCAVVPAYHWLEFDDPDLADVARFSGRTGGLLEIQPMMLTSYGVFEPTRASALVPRYLGIQGPVRKRIRFALDRFDRAMRRHNPGDAAVELAFALDSLL